MNGLRLRRLVLPLCMSCGILMWLSLIRFMKHELTNKADPVPSVNVARRPPLTSLVDGNKVIGDPQFLLDFAILGFAKCGTTTMMNWLNQQQAHCFPDEIYDLMHQKPAQLIRRLYNERKNCYKSPNDISQAHVLEYFRRYWPSTPLFVGVRHPIRWFESLYNFRVNNYDSMPPATQLIGKCIRGTQGICTNRGRFHIVLAKLGKTNMTTAPEEVEMKARYPREFREEILGIPNKIFLYTTEQLADTNEMRTEIFRNDVQDFCGLQLSLPIPYIKPGILWDETTQTQKDGLKINICDSNYTELRKVLLDMARPASVWIRKYFIESEDVVVSSKEYFKEIIETWMHDPCDIPPDVAT